MTLPLPSVAGMSPALWLAVAGAVAVGLLVLLAVRLRRGGRGKLATRVTVFATLLGLAWSAQGMWDTAVHHYDQDVIVASVLFLVFESMMVARMMKAHQYRTDPDRRARHVRAVWIIAIVMALVVALGEGWAQAPARLAIPILVAYGWHTDLTADDAPGTRLTTSWIYTPRYVGLMLGLLRPGAADAHTIDRDRLRDRMTRLAFREKYGADWVSGPLRRRVRLARMATVADADDLREVADRLHRADVVWTSREEWAPAPVARDLGPTVISPLDIGPERPPAPEVDPIIHVTLFNGQTADIERATGRIVGETAAPLSYPLPDPILTVELPDGTRVDIDRATEQVIGVGRRDPVDPPEPPEKPKPKEKTAPKDGGRVGYIDDKPVTLARDEAVVDGKIVGGPLLRALARERYRDSIKAGKALSQRDLGKLYGMSQMWGRERIAEAFAEETEPATEPAEEPELQPV